MNARIFALARLCQTSFFQHIAASLNINRETLRGDGATKIWYNNNVDASTLCKGDDDHNSKSPGSDFDACRQTRTYNSVKLLCYHDGATTCPADDVQLDENLLLHPLWSDSAWTLDVTAKKTANDAETVSFGAHQSTRGYIHNYRDHAPMQPDSTYTVKVWARTTATAGTLNMYTCTNSDPNRLVGRVEGVYHKIPQNDDWNLLTWVFLNPSNSECKSISFRYEGIGGSNRLWLSKPTLVKGNSTLTGNDAENNLLLQPNFTAAAIPASSWNPQTLQSNAYVKNVTKNEIVGPPSSAGFDVIGVSTVSDRAHLVQKGAEVNVFKPLTAGGSYAFSMQMKASAADGVDYGASPASVIIYVCSTDARAVFKITASGGGWVNSRIEFTLPTGTTCKHARPDYMLRIRVEGIKSAISFQQPMLQRVACTTTTTTTATTTTTETVVIGYFDAFTIGNSVYEYQCPAGTFVYHSGSHCCRVNRDADGNPLRYDGPKCENNNHLPCPGGAVDHTCGNDGATLHLRGWACAYGVASSINLHVYIGGQGEENLENIVPIPTANIAREQAVSNSCGTQNVNHGFLVKIPFSELKTTSGRVHILGLSPAGSQHSDAWLPLSTYFLSNSGTNEIQVTTSTTATTAITTTLLQCDDVPVAGVSKVLRQSFGPPTSAGLIGNTSAMQGSNWTFSYGTRVAYHCPGNPYPTKVFKHDLHCTPDHEQVCNASDDAPFVMVYNDGNPRGMVSFTLPEGYCGFRLKVREISTGGTDLVQLDNKTLFGLPEGGCTANPVVVSSTYTPGQVLTLKERSILGIYWFELINGDACSSMLATPSSCECSGSCKWAESPTTTPVGIHFTDVVAAPTTAAAMTTAAAAATSPTVDSSVGINSDTSASPNAGLIAGILSGLVACGIGAAVLIRRKKKPSAEDAAAVAELQEEEARRNTTIMEVNPHLAALKAKKAASLSAALPSSTLIKSTSTVHNPAFVGIKLAEGGSSGNPAMGVDYNPANEPVGSGEYIDVADENTGFNPDQISQPWFVRGMDKGECKARVAAAKKQGSFLVRVSRKTAGAYVFCINLGDGQVQEDLAKPGRGGQLALYFNQKGATPPQPDLVSLVEYCQTHSLTPSVGITLKLGVAAPAVLAEYAQRAATASDAVYATLYGQVDSGLLQFYNRVAVENHEKDEPRPDNDPLAALASTPTVSLEKAIKAAEIDCGAGSLAEFLRKARAFRANNAADLSRFQMPDEAIETFYMYTVESPLYKKMNAALGNYTLDDDEDDPRSKLKHYLPFVKLLAAAIDLLPSVRQIVYRGANQPYEVLLNGKGVGEIITWWGFTSTSEKTRALQTPAFLNAVVTTTPDGTVIGVNNLEVYANLGPPPKKTIFQIHTISGVNIKCFSPLDEDEIILRAGTRFLITSIKLWKHGITEVRMTEVDSFSNAADEPVAYNEIDHYMALDPEVNANYAVINPESNANYAAINPESGAGKQHQKVVYSTSFEPHEGADNMYEPVDLPSHVSLGVHDSSA